MIKLHLGCGTKKIEGFINVDVRKLSNVDVCADISNLPFKDDTVDLIYSCANLEHFSRLKWKSVLKHWYDILKFGGELQLSTMDFESIVWQYMKYGKLNSLLGLLIGGQNNDYDFHGMIFDFDILSSGLKEVGFKNTKRCNWDDFEPYKLDSKYDDYARAYLPHKDFINGKCMMLNIIAIK